MEPALREVFRHNAWANLRQLDFLLTLTPARLAASTDAIYGNIVDTMQHLVGSEHYYWSLFSGRQLPWEWHEPATVAELTAWAEDMRRSWDELLAGEIDAEAMLEQQRDDGTVRRTKAGVVLLQALHHGNVHREQVSHVLTTLGLEAPDVSGWAFGRETERIQ